MALYNFWCLLFGKFGVEYGLGHMRSNYRMYRTLAEPVF